MKLFYKKKQDMISDFVDNENDKMMSESFETNKSRVIYIINKFLPVLVIIIFIYFVIALWGGITLKNKDFLDIRYDVSVNDTILATEVTTDYKNTIIPFVLKTESHNTYYYNRHGYDSQHIELEKSDKYLLNVTGSYCYYKFNKKEKRSFCHGHTNLEVSFVENTETKYTKLTILDSYNEKTVYEGIFINDITQYVSTPSEYLVTINGKYKHAIVQIKALVITT